MGSVKRYWVIMVLVVLAGCGGVMDDLHPSGNSKLPIVARNTTGPAVGQHAPDFTVSDTFGNSVTLSSAVTGTDIKGVVLYFTMWCPVCDTHMSHIRDSIMPQFPDMLYFAVDYVSGTVAQARQSEMNNGYDGSGFRVLADTSNSILNSYNATMGTTVVIDRSGIVRMNEDFKDGTRLQNILGTLP